MKNDYNFKIWQHDKHLELVSSKLWLRLMNKKIRILELFLWQRFTNQWVEILTLIRRMRKVCKSFLIDSVPKCNISINNKARILSWKILMQRLLNKHLKILENNIFRIENKILRPSKPWLLKDFLELERRSQS